MSIPIQVIVSDGGGVLFGPTPEKYPDQEKEIRQLHKSNPIAWSKIKKDPNFTVKIKETTEELKAGIRESFVIFQGELDLMEQQGIEIAILSNHATDWVDWMAARWLHAYKPELIMVSQTMALAKPDPAIFAAAHAILEKSAGHSIPRAAVVFVDDKIENTSAAEAFGKLSVAEHLGWVGVIYDNTKETTPALAAKLASLPGLAGLAQ